MMHTYPHPMMRNIRLPSFAQALQSLGFVLLRIIITLAVVLLAVPVALLPVGTAVPASVWVMFAIVDVALIIVLIRFARTRRAVIGALLGFVVVAMLAVVASQAFATTPPIVGANGKPIPGSIAVMEKVELGGSEQWITIRGKDVNKPVLLYLGIGGPGAGGFPASALTLAPLEEHFVVVNWDQPGTGKSYHAVPIATLTVERFVSDAHELTQLLRALPSRQDLCAGLIVGHDSRHQAGAAVSRPVLRLYRNRADGQYDRERSYGLCARAQDCGRTRPNHDTQHAASQWAAALRWEWNGHEICGVQ
jgi:hypothetical protein